MNTRRLHRISTALALSAVFALGACESEDDVAAPVLDEGAMLTAGVALPDAATLTEKLGTDEKQSQELTSALSKWQDAAVSAERTPAGRPGPLMGFLVEASTFLDHEQKVKLVHVLADQREQWREQRADRRQGRRGSARHQRRGMREDALLGGFADELNLDDEQKAQLEQLRADMREQMQSLRGDRPRRGGPDEPMREKVSALREEHREQVASILSAEQQTQLQELREERRGERQGAYESRRAAQAGQRLESLAVVLDLSQDQLEQIRDIQEAQRAKIDEIREGFRAEAQQRARPHSRETRESHRALFETIREDGQKQVRALLSEEQQELFDALEMLRGEGPAHGGHHRHGGSGKGFGHRGQGPRR